MADTYVNVGIVQSDGTLFDLSKFIDKNSFSFGITPRLVKVVQTMDGFERIAGGGYKQTLRFKFNPMTAQQAVSVLQKLFETPAYAVQYNGLLPPDSGLGYYSMRLSDVSFEYLSKCRFCLKNWFQFDEIEMVEL